MLGGSMQQVAAIQTAKRLGFATVLCDYLPDNPGQHHADKFYQVSTTDKEAVLDVARKEQIHGIVAYASDPAAPTAAYVAEKLGLPGNPLWAVETLCNKDRFRLFLKENGFHAPESQGYGAVEDALADTARYSLPVIVKPVDSSGSKGTTVLHSWDNLEDALHFAFSYSRSHRIIVEGFVEKAHPYLIGGDIFVVDGKVVLWGLLNCHRDSAVNPLVPVGKSYPLELSESAEKAVRETLQKMVTQLQIRFGAMNVELVVDSKGDVWPIDIGPRNGGNMIPELLGYIFGVDVVEMTIKSAMGQPIHLDAVQETPYYATHNLHSQRNGTFSGIAFSKEIEKFIVRKSIYKTAGDSVEYFDNAAKALGILFMKFPDLLTMRSLLSNINSHITILLEEKS